MNKLKLFWGKFKYIFLITSSVSGFLFTFIPESCFLKGFIKVDFQPETVIIFNRIFFFLFIFLIVSLLYRFRKSVEFSNRNYTIKVEYNDIFSMNDCVKVINFDEIFTTNIGLNKADIKKESICGQFLSKQKDFDIDSILAKSDLAPSGFSSFNKRECYEPGDVVPYKDDYLLLAFAKLDKEGCGCLTREEFFSCLNNLWNNLNKYCNTKDVAIPVLGGGITRFNGVDPSTQELVDIIITSYKLSPVKIKSTLHIVCLEQDGFSLNNIGDTL